MNAEMYFYVFAIIFLIALLICFVAFIIHRLKLGKERLEKLRQSIQDKHYENLTNEERLIALSDIQTSYGAGMLTLMQYDFLKSKIDGTKSMAEIMGVDAAMNINSTEVQSQMQSTKQTDGTKTIVKDAVIGGVIAGPTGAVVGAIVGKNKADHAEKK